MKGALTVTAVIFCSALPHAATPSPSTFRCFPDEFLIFSAVSGVSNPVADNGTAEPELAAGTEPNKNRPLRSR